MTEILIALPVEYSSIILADKLNSDSNFKVTFYVDPLIDSEFQSSAINDIQSVSTDPVKTIQNKVGKSWLPIINLENEIGPSGVGAPVLKWP